ncbi:MAG: GNAT family N-acetyltransferase [Bryobacteraceae bacterium]|nr:GNAT family N-acetyltransferase [Bryobacteraceae bacterium]
MVAETGRLRLYSWRAEDWVAFAPVARDPEVMRYITGGVPWSDERVQEFVSKQITRHADEGYCRWRLAEKATGATVGFCGGGRMHGLAEEEVEVGWWLARSHWGRGLATEAARAAIHDLFTRVGLSRVVSMAARENAASLRIMAKLGYTFVREQPYREFIVHIHELTPAGFRVS